MPFSSNAPQVEPSILAKLDPSALAALAQMEASIGSALTSLQPQLMEADRKEYKQVRPLCLVVTCDFCCYPVGF